MVFSLTVTISKSYFVVKARVLRLEIEKKLGLTKPGRSLYGELRYMEARYIAGGSNEWGSVVFKVSILFPDETMKNIHILKGGR